MRPVFASGDEYELSEEMIAGREYDPNMRANKLPFLPGSSPHLILQAIAAGQVTREDTTARRGMWALHVHNGHEVGMTVRQLGRLNLVEVHLAGPATITADGLALLAAMAD